MRRSILSLLFVVGCGGPSSSGPTSQAPVTKPEPVHVDVTPPASASTSPPTPAPAASASASQTSAPPAPPARATTIPLARTGDEKIDALLREGDRAFEAGTFDQALASYEAAKKAAGSAQRPAGPTKAAGIVGVARTRIAKASPSLGFAAAENKAEVSAATKELKTATDLDPNFGPGQIEYGRALLLLGNAPLAEAALRKGVRLLSDEPEAHSALGVALLATGKADEALTELTRARDLDPGNAARRGNLGTALFMRGRVAEAIKEYEVQVRLLPDDARAHSDLGTALLAQSDFTRAIPELERAIKLDGSRATFRSNLGYAFQLAGRLPEAVAQYREAIKLDPKLASAWINLATALARDPKTRGEARQALKTAEKLDPSDPRVKANLEELDALEGSTKPKSH